MGKVNITFKYTNAADSSKPGYLARRFAAIRKEQAEQKAKLEAEAAALLAEQHQKIRRIAK